MRKNSLPLILSALTLLIVSAACGGNESPVLIVPAPATSTITVPTTDSQSSTVAPTVDSPPAAGATIQPTATLPLMPTVVPPLPTDTPDVRPPTATPAPTSEPETTADYRVAFVAANDTLNVRRRPGTNAAVIAELPADATGIQVIDEGETLLGDSLWLPVETAAGDGWVNSRFLTEDIGRDRFCADPEVNELLDALQEAIANEDGELLRELVHPDRGLRLRVNWWNNEILVTGEEVETLFLAPTQYDWGIEDGSGEEIRGSFNEIMMPRLERDLLGATTWACDEGLFGGTAGSTVLPEEYEAVRFYSAHRAAPADLELDWGTWLIGVERWEGRYYVSYLVHYRWEI